MKKNLLLVGIFVLFSSLAQAVEDTPTDDEITDIVNQVCEGQNGEEMTTNWDLAVSSFATNKGRHPTPEDHLTISNKIQTLYPEVPYGDSKQYFEALCKYIKDSQDEGASNGGGVPSES